MEEENRLGKVLGQVHPIIATIEVSEFVPQNGLRRLGVLGVRQQDDRMHEPQKQGGLLRVVHPQSDPPAHLQASAQAHKNIEELAARSLGSALELSNRQ